jgi:shikimate dehydrogenase
MELREAPAADFAVLGDPVSHSKSPMMHHALYEAMGWAYRYVALRVPPEELDDCLIWLHEADYRGVNITVPLKEVAANSALVQADAFSRRVGAVNTIDLRDGPPFRATNTDAPGFVETLRRAGVEPGAEVLLMGVGGSGRALAAAMDDAGYRVSIWNRTPTKASQLIVDFELHNTRLFGSGETYQVLVNATSSSLHGERLPLPWDDLFGPGVIAIDLMYADAPTLFLEDAFARGATAYDGRELLAAQGALSVAYWLGVEPPFEVMRAALGSAT